jgi:hypothetical protein
VVRSGTASFLAVGGVLDAHGNRQEDDHGVATPGSDVMGREGGDYEPTSDEEKLRRCCGVGELAHSVVGPVRADPTAGDAAD